MEYKIESIGAQFSNKDIPKLAKQFNKHAGEGYKFYSVFQVSQPGCFLTGGPTITNLAVYVKEEE
jgi:hypothetical protein